MSNKENKVKVEIFGSSYILKGESDVGYMQKLASYVDRKMRQIQEDTKIISPTKIAILAALNITDELLRSSPGKIETFGVDTALAKRAIELIEKIEKELK